MPRGKARKGGALEKFLEKEIGRSFVAILEERGLATIKDVKKILEEIKTLRRQVKAVGAGKGAKGKGGGRSGRRRTHAACTTPGCKKEHYAKGLCASHYQKSRRDDGGVKKAGRKKKS